MLNVAVVASSSLIFASGHKEYLSSCMDLSQAEQLPHASVTKLSF